METWDPDASERFCFACSAHGHWAEECPVRLPPPSTADSQPSLAATPRNPRTRAHALPAKDTGANGDTDGDTETDAEVEDLIEMVANNVDRLSPSQSPHSRMTGRATLAGRRASTMLQQSPTAPETPADDRPESGMSSTSQKSSHWETARTKLRALRAFKGTMLKKDAATFIKDAQTAVAKAKGTGLDLASRLADERRASILKLEKRTKMSDDMLQAYVKEILEKNPEERTDEDKNALKDYTKKLKFFMNMSTNVHADLCKVMQHVTVPAGEVVFYQGSIGKTFYVILSGSVTIHVKSADEERHEVTAKPIVSLLKDTGNKRSSISKLSVDKNLSLGAAPQQTPEQPMPTQEEGYDFGRLVGTLSSGDAFGELALLTNPPAPRAASIIAVEDTQFLTIHKTDYDRTLKRIQVQQLENKLIFLRSLSIFRSWDSKRLTRFSHFMKNHTFNASETIIIKQAEVSDNIFMIYRGACRIIFLAELENDRNANPPWAQMEDSSVFFKTLSLNYTPMPYTLMAPQKRRIKIELAVLGPGEMFGEGGVVAGAPQVGMVIAENDTELLVINKSDFLKRMDEQSKQIVKKVWEMKSAWLEKRLQDIIQLKLKNRPTDIITNMNQGSATPRQAPIEIVADPHILSRDVLHYLGPPARRPHPPDPERMKSLVWFTDSPHLD
eukprot:TRINITY_DN3923_c0_g1_i14.p1 TRINITY_DN3923_c0_g1~~TRINITY_DN3923_c0_g1_i14.p1  ORF type:complete len:670 (+),score=132.25 TRINITY_DN3923_c0_g1_i14:100-2109(+)